MLHVGESVSMSAKPGQEQAGDEGGAAFLMSQMNWMDTSVLLGSFFGIMADVE